MWFSVKWGVTLWTAPAPPRSRPLTLATMPAAPAYWFVYPTSMRTCVCVCVCKLFRLCKRICCAHTKVCNEKFARHCVTAYCWNMHGAAKKGSRASNKHCALHHKHPLPHTHTYSHFLPNKYTATQTICNCLIKFLHTIGLKCDIVHEAHLSIYIIYVYSMHISISISLCHIRGSIFSIACQSMLAKRILSILPYINLHLSPFSHCVLSVCVCGCIGCVLRMNASQGVEPWMIVLLCSPLLFIVHFYLLNCGII